MKWAGVGIGLAILIRLYGLFGTGVFLLLVVFCSVWLSSEVGDDY